MADNHWSLDRCVRQPAGQVALVAGLMFTAGGAALAQTITLDKFEGSAIRIVQPGQPDPLYRDLWNEWPDPPGLATLSTAQAHDGTKSLKVSAISGSQAPSDADVYLEFYPNDGTFWHFMREFTQPNTSWVLNTFNRMRFWMKVPSQAVLSTPGQSNMNIGTYVHQSGGDFTSAEDGGNHYYHFFNLPYTGEWHQVIMDMHPNHQRGGDGNYEWGNMPYPTGQPGFNYFDALTRFYVQQSGGAITATPVDWYFDGFELYKETNDENVDQIYSLNGVYVPASHKVRVGWQRNKNEDTVRHEVRYSFQDIFRSGWATALPAPNSMVTPPNSRGYNGMEWETTTINTTGHTVIYIGIKPENSARFRQIAIPLSGGGGGGTAPAAPNNVRIGQ